MVDQVLLQYLLQAHEIHEKMDHKFHTSANREQSMQRIAGKLHSAGDSKSQDKLDSVADISALQVQASESGPSGESGKN